MRIWYEGSVGGWWPDNQSLDLTLLLDLLEFLDSLKFSVIRVVKVEFRHWLYFPIVDFPEIAIEICKLLIDGIGGSMSTAEFTIQIASMQIYTILLIQSHKA